MTASAGTVHMLAHAKVNLFLAVGERRSDGYHDVTTVLQALALADEVTVTIGGDVVRVECEPDLGVREADNLAYRAALAWGEASRTSGGASITVRKRIPAGAGLGGGSSDAAAVLAALSGWHHAGAPMPVALRTAAADLGADVPFFLGAGTMLMGGRGDEPVEELPTPRLDIVLVNPGVPVPTGAAYAQLDRMVGRSAPSPDAMVRAVRADDAEAIAAALYDGMTEASAALVPEIRGALRSLTEARGVMGAAMAGSGSTVFGICEDGAAARRVAADAGSRGWWACATSSSPAGLERALGPEPR